MNVKENLTKDATLRNSMEKSFTFKQVNMFLALSKQTNIKKKLQKSTLNHQRQLGKCNNKNMNTNIKTAKDMTNSGQDSLKSKIQIKSVRVDFEL